MGFDTSAKERNLEKDIEAYLTSPEGGYLKGDDKHSLRFVEDLGPEDGCSYQEIDGGYRTLPGQALDIQTLCNFIETTQPTSWKHFTKQHPQAPEKAFADAFQDAVSCNGVVHVLKHGFKTRGITFKVVYFKTESGLNENAAERYRKNVCRCIRQFHYAATGNKTVDIVLDVNGIPLVGIELKDQFTGQTYEYAEKQWRRDRDPREACFKLNNRMLAFFAVDMDNASVTTQLAGEETQFLPFNQGSNGPGQDGGAGNPANPEGYATSYLWEEVLAKDSLLDIIQKFVFVQKGDGGKSRIIFPRCHQLDVVRKLVAAVSAHGPGENYLVQHSAGSGKSNSIAWTAYRLASLFDADDKPMFDSVAVITDRRVLDAQLQATIEGMDHQLGSIRTIGKDKTSKDLRDALNGGARLVVCTLQKFPVIFDQVEHTGKHFAVIVDEAHSSQTGRSAQKMRTALADTTDALEEWAEIESEAEEVAGDTEDELVREMATHGRHANLTFCAFTATPKAQTLEAFGTPQVDGSFRPFHIYSMRQAVQEGFILDPLEHYVTYTEAVEMARTVPENPELPTSPTLKLLRRYKEVHPYVIRQKVEIAVETFRSTTREAIGGRGKMMVVTSSRLAAVRYLREMRAYLNEKGYHDIEALVAFSGSVSDPDDPDSGDVTEASLNVGHDGGRVAESQTAHEFHEHGDILIVAEKYQTGFDEPYLHTMIVDKKLKDVKAVQTLSRVDRTCPGKHDTLIVDFVNDPDTIQQAFQPYYGGVELTRHLNVDLIYKTQAELRGFHVYGDEDVLAASKIVFADDAATRSQAQGQLSGMLKPAVERYLELDDDARYEFRRKVRSFLKWYSYITVIARMFDADLHREYTYLGYLNHVLPAEHVDITDIDGMVEMRYYQLKDDFDGSIELEPQTAEVDPDKPGGAGKADRSTDPLQELIDRINEQYAGEFTDEDRVVLAQLSQRLADDPEVDEALREDGDLIFKNNTFPDIFERTLTAAFSENMEAFQSLLQDREKHDAVKNVMAEMLLERKAN